MFYWLCFTAFQNYSLSELVSYKSNGQQWLTSPKWLCGREVKKMPASLEHSCQHVPASLICNPTCWPGAGIFLRTNNRHVTWIKLFEVCVVLNQEREWETGPPQTSNALNSFGDRCLRKLPGGDADFQRINLQCHLAPCID